MPSIENNFREQTSASNPSRLPDAWGQASPLVKARRAAAGAIPSMDKLANQGKMATLKHARTPASIVSAASAGNQPADPNAAKKWLDGWQDRENEKAEAARPTNLVQEEKKLRLPSLKQMHGSKPKSQWEEAKVGLDEGLTRIGQTVAGLGAMVGVPGSETRRELYGERAATMNAYRKRGAPSEGYSGGDIVSAAVKEAPEWVNPFSAPGKVAKVGNAAYHAARGYAPEKSVMDGAIASVSNVIGEKAEDLVTRGKGLVGNIAGSVTEKAASYFREQQPATPKPPRQKQTTDARGKALVKARRARVAAP